MPTKVFFEWNGLPVSSDVRDICLPGGLDYDVYHWTKLVSLKANIYMKLGDRSIWRIIDDQERMMFKLKWAPHET